jgi:hypothetical protein
MLMRAFLLSVLTITLFCPGCGLQEVRGPYGGIYRAMDCGWDNTDGGYQAEIRRYYVATHPGLSETTADNILGKTISLGMTSEEVRYAWTYWKSSEGYDPVEINRSVGSWGVHEQWVLGNYTRNSEVKYLYFENGVLTSWSN